MHAPSPRFHRRATSRDLSRANPIPPRPKSYGEVAEFVHTHRPMPVRPPSERSGQTRRNAKRNARAEYWRTVAIRVSADMEQYFHDSLHQLGDGTRIVSRTKLANWLAYDFNVHIPGAPATAVRAEPIWWSDYDADTGLSTVRLHYVRYQDAAGQPIEVANQMAAVAS